MKNLMVILRGAPGAGKSFWADKYMLEFYNGRHIVLINKDNLRWALFGDYEPVHDEALVHQTMLNKIYDCIVYKFDMIVDNTHLTEKSVKELTKIADAHDYMVQIYDFRDIPLETCLERNAARERKVPEWVIVKMWNNHIKPLIKDIPFA